jgi:hypothetical protein
MTDDGKCGTPQRRVRLYTHRYYTADREFLMVEYEECMECGCVVSDQDMHDHFHDKLDHYMAGLGSVLREAQQMMARHASDAYAHQRAAFWSGMSSGNPL